MPLPETCPTHITPVPRPSAVHTHAPSKCMRKINPASVYITCCPLSATGLTPPTTTTTTTTPPSTHALRNN
ncbi:hypothetical protein E2C01_062736 [Portunus trituberculatus]|uniref:Uncharacterized protein n=1 Tax=Portunus trituberculatus TaxID=210409 RepID=A0A5B7HIV9_PORTR|nr:hypothetical protein [Portunus trituberculatus]